MDKYNGMETIVVKVHGKGHIHIYIYPYTLDTKPICILWVLRRGCTWTIYSQTAPHACTAKAASRGGLHDLSNVFLVVKLSKIIFLYKILYPKRRL